MMISRPSGRSSMRWCRAAMFLLTRLIPVAKKPIASGCSFIGCPRKLHPDAIGFFATGIRRVSKNIAALHHLMEDLPDGLEIIISRQTDREHWRASFLL